ncbi:MAG: 1-acyl-sn-glycerol-3-phosphate acyltransferase [Candidatus Omnitrophota bacterium]
MMEALNAGFKDFIILKSGQRIYPEEIEAFYRKAAPIKDICVFTVSGMGGVKKSKVLWAVIQPDLAQFREFAEVNLRLVLKEKFDNASPSLPSYKRIKGFTVTLEDLPHIRFGKLKRYVIKNMYESRVVAGTKGSLPVSGELLEDDAILIGSEIGIKTLECLKELCGIRRPIILEDSLELDLGIDSLGRVELASGLELAFSADIKDEVVSRAFSVKDLILGVTDALSGAKGISLDDQALSSGPDYWKKSLQVPPKEEHLGALELGNGFFARLFRFTITAIFSLIMRLFFSIKVEGQENVPKEGACILYPNHTSFLDGPAIAASLPHRRGFQIFYFIFIPYFFRPFIKSRLLRNIVKMERFIPFDFSTHFLESLRSCYYVLDHGKNLCFFPEGIRSSTGVVGKFKSGFGILAKETGAKLVPVAIEGAHEAWGSAAKYPRRYPIRVRFGKPLLVKDLEKEGLTCGSRDCYDAICVAARKALVELKDKR